MKRRNNSRSAGRLRSRRNHRQTSFASHPSRRFEQLENRWLLTVGLTLGGAQSIVHNTNIDASNDHVTQQQNMAIDINPLNPLHVSGVSEQNNPTTGTTLGLYRSANGGLTWTTTTINGSVDSHPTNSIRTDPSIAYDANGNLYVSYIVKETFTSTLVVLTSTDDGATFTHVVEVDSLSLTGVVASPRLATGPDGLGGQAVYVAYTFADSATGNFISVAGSNDGGTTFTSPVHVSNNTTHNFANGNPSVGPSGQLYVSWFDTTDLAVRFDRDLDGLFAAVNNFGADTTVVDNTTARPSSGNFTLFFNHLVPAAPNLGISSAPQLDTDRTGGSSDGNLYITFVDLFDNASNDTDIYIARSVNQGTAWTLLPVRTSGVTEFMPQVDVDQTTGAVNVMYYSTVGDASGNDDVNVELAISTNAGSSFINDQQLTSATSHAASITGGNDFGDYNGLAVHDGTVQGLWSDNRGLSTEAEAFTTSASFNSATNANVLQVTGTAGADTVFIRRNSANHAFLEVVVNGQIQFDGLIATVDSIVVQTLADSDTLTVDNANGIVNLPINYDGGTSLLDSDKLVITGNPGTPVARETYVVGATTGTGNWVLDPDGSLGPGLTGTANGDELQINFSNLEPVDSDTPALVFDTIMNTMPNDATVQNGGLLNGANSLRVLDNNATFETFRFANKSTVRIMGQSGADTITVDFTTAAAGLTNLQIYGHVAPDVLGQPADDNAADNLKVFRNTAGIAYTLAGQGGNDNFIVGNGDLSLILAPVSVIGGDGTDGLTVDDSARLIAVNYVVDPTHIAIRNVLVPPPPDSGIATYDGTLENIQLDGTQGPNQFDVSPSTTAVFFINGHLPTSAGPGADILVLHPAGTTGRVLTYDPITGNGNWMFDAPYKTINFTSIEQLKFAPMLVYSADAAKNGKPTVKVVDADTGALITSFLAYDVGYKQGVRVALGDINGDGIPELITAPGHDRAAVVKVWNLVSADLTTPPTLLETFTAYANSNIGGAMVAVGDVNGDGLNDIVVAPSRGKAQINVFINQFATTPATPFDNGHRNSFLAFAKNIIGGATVAVGDVLGDSKAEIIVGSGGGQSNRVKIFDGLSNTGTNTVATALQWIFPFDAKLRTGVYVAVANIDTDAKLELVVGAANGGRSLVSTFDPNSATPTTPVATFVPYTGNGSNAPVRVAAVTETDPSGNLVSAIVLAQGPDGKSQLLRRTNPSGPPVDFLMENDPEFRNGFYIAAAME